MKAFFTLVALIPLAMAADVPVAVPQAAWDVLDKGLHDGSAEHRQQTLAALATMGESDEAVKRVESALDDKDPMVRQSAALALGQMQAHAAAPRLQQALDDNSPEVAFAAAKSLEELGDESGQPMLIAVLAGERKDSAGMMTNAMRKAKGKLHHPEGLILMGAQDATGAMFGPVSLAFPVMKDAVDLKGKGAPGRAAAAAFLAKDPDPYAVQLLEWALDDDNQFVKVEAVKGLGQRGNAESAMKMQPLLNESHTLVRYMAAASILRIHERDGAAGEVSSTPLLSPGPPVAKK